MSILNNDVLVQETPTKLTLETVLDYVLDKTGINITKYPTATQLKQESEQSIKTKSGGETVKFAMDMRKFNYDFKPWIQELSNKNGFSQSCRVECSLKQLTPKSHQVHTDSDNSFGEAHTVFSRFSIPLTISPPTIYYDKCMHDDEFYTRVSKNTFRTITKQGRWEEFEIDNLLDLKTQQNVLISGEGYTQEQLIKYKISHVGLDQLFGLKVYKVCDWEPGTIQFFPCSLLHSSSDHTRWNEEEFNTKYFLTGVLYDQRKHQTKSIKSTIGSQEAWTKKKWENKRISSGHGHKHRIIEKIRVIGAGTAGLIFSTYFKKMLPDLEVDLYYDPNKKPLVVGESMQPYMRYFFEKVFDDESWMDQTNATYKFYIKHDGWANENSSMTFPLCDDRFDNIEECEKEIFSADKNNVPECSSRHAWQMQSVLLQPILIEKCKELGINLIEKNYDFTNTDKFAIDCRGFDALGGEVISPLIINDTAIAGHVDHFKDTKERYYTRTKATDNGWFWEIPLQNKVGVGRVYCSRYNTEEEIKKQLSEQYGLNSFLKVPFKTRYKETVCTMHTLKVGSAAAFIEPLEATTLLLVVYSCYLFKEMLESFQFRINDDFVKHYNENYKQMMQNHIAFIEGFYGLSDRNDSPYWNEIDKHRKQFRDSHEWPEFYGEYIKKKMYDGLSYNIK